MADIEAGLPQHYEDERDIASVDPEVYAEHVGDVTEPFDYIGAENAIEDIVQMNIGEQYDPILQDALMRNRLCNANGFWRGVTIEDLQHIREHVQVSRYDSFLNHVAIRSAELRSVQNVEQLYAECKPVVDLTATTAGEIHRRDVCIEEKLRDSFVKAEDLALEKFRISLNCKDVEMGYFYDLKHRNAAWNGRDIKGRWRNLFITKLNHYMYQSLLLSFTNCDMIVNYLESKFRMP